MENISSGTRLDDYGKIRHATNGKTHTIIVYPKWNQQTNHGFQMIT